jgi:hypothetical protein
VRERLGLAFEAITAPGSPSLLQQSATLSHYQAHGGATDAYNRARIAARSTARKVLDRIGGQRP